MDYCLKKRRNAITSPALWAAKINRISERYKCLQERGRWRYLAHSVLSAVSRKKLVLFMLYNKFLYWPSLSGQNGRILIGFVLFYEFIDLDSFSVHTRPKGNLANIQPSWQHTRSITNNSWILDISWTCARQVRPEWQRKQIDRLRVV